jgi:hypothetical protein
MYVDQAIRRADARPTEFDLAMIGAGRPGGGGHDRLGLKEHRVRSVAGAWHSNWLGVFIARLGWIDTTLYSKLRLGQSMTSLQVDAQSLKGIFKSAYAGENQTPNLGWTGGRYGFRAGTWFNEMTGPPTCRL